MKFRELKNLRAVPLLGHDGNLRSALIGNCLLLSFLSPGIDGDLDSDGPPAKFLTLESLDRLLLFGLITNIDKTVALALTAIQPANDASGDNLDAGLGEQVGECGVVDVEAKIGNEKNRLGGLAGGLVTPSTARESPPPLADRLTLLGGNCGLSLAIGDRGLCLCLLLIENRLR